MDLESSSISPISISSPPYKKKGVYIVDAKRELPRVYASKPASLSSATVTPDKDTLDDSLDANLLSAKHLNRSLKVGKRKDVARRHLLGSIYTKHNSVKRSFSFVAGEHPQVEIRLPRVCYRDKTSQGPTHQQKHGGTVESPDPRHRRPSLTLADTKTKLRSGDNNKNERIQRTNSHKVSLPEIIMEFNLEANMSMHERKKIMKSPTDAEEEEEERALGAPYEDYLNRPKYVINSPYKSKYRPVTPGLLESLNKLKVPSKVKTEQWVKSSQVAQKSYCAETYKVGNLDNTNLAFPNWIYTDT